jgi:hypothetical protein
MIMPGKVLCRSKPWQEAIICPHYRIANAIRPRMMISARMLRILFSNLVTCMGMAAEFEPLWQDG